MDDGSPAAMVTGGATGIGAACCRALAAEGFRVVIHYHASMTRAQELATECGNALALGADLTVPAEIDELVQALRANIGRLDVLVNNAGVNRNAPMPAMTLADFEATAGMSRGTWYLTKLVLRRFMLRAGCGRIINISSVVGHTGNAGQVPYTMEKAGIDAMTRSLARELHGRGVLVNSVAPGLIDTEMTRELPASVREEILRRVPLARLGAAEEVADVVAFLATRATYVTGTVLHVNGGLYGG